MNQSIDERIKQALGFNGDPTAPTGNEASLFQLVGDTIRGRHRVLTTIALAWSFAFFGLTVFAAVQMFRAPELRETVLWSVGVSFGSLAVAMLKMWFWMQMEKYTLIREIKRLEVQVARLAERSAHAGHGA